MSSSGISRRAILKVGSLGVVGASLDFGLIRKALAAGDLNVGVV